MKKRILALAMATVMAGSLTAYSGPSRTGIKIALVEIEAPTPENKSEAKRESKAGERDAVNTASSEGGFGGCESAPVADLRTIDNKSSNQDAWEGLKKRAEESSISYKYYQPQEDTTDPYLETIGLTTEGGARLVVYLGPLSEEPIYLARDKYPNVRFILLDGEPHDTDYNYRTNDDAMPILFQEDQAGFLAGYMVVKDDYTKFGFIGDMAVPAVVRFGYGFVQGVELAVEEDRITGLETMYNHTDAFSATPEAQSMAVSWYQNSTEVILRCGGTVGNSVMAAAQEKNTKIIGVNVNQSAGSETVITSAMKLLSNSVYDRVEDFYDGSPPGGKTSVFTTVNNGVGLPMDVSKFERPSQGQYDAVYKKLTDEGIGLVRFSADDNDPTKDSIDLTNIKVTFAEWGLVAIQTVQGPEMTCSGQS